MAGLIDLHTHILPNVDDGADSLDEALKLLAMEYNDGVSAVALTPHFMCGKTSIQKFLDRRDQNLQGLESAIREQGLSINLVRGAEVFLSPDLPKLENLEKLCYASTRYILVELPTDFYREWIPDVLYQLQLREMIPIIAHVERYDFFARHLDALDELVRAGAMTQVNASSILEGGLLEHRFINKLFYHNLVHIIATDSHSIAHRPPKMKKAFEKIKKKYGRELVDYLIKSSEAFINNRRLDSLESLKTK